MFIIVDAISLMQNGVLHKSPCIFTGKNVTDHALPANKFEWTQKA